MRSRELMQRLDRLEGKAGGDGAPLVVLHLPYAGDRYGIGYAAQVGRQGNLVIHELGCGFHGGRCAGAPDCLKVSPVAKMAEMDLKRRIADLEYLRRVHVPAEWDDGAQSDPAEHTVFLARMDELDALTAELAVRSVTASEATQ